MEQEDGEQKKMEGLIVSSEQRKESDVVVAVDFGTSRTAAHITLVGRSHDVRIPVSLDGCPASIAGSSKTSTCLLVENAEGICFGARAERWYASDGDDHPNWRLFKWFKMNLHKPFEEDPSVDDVSGQESLPLSVILRECFKLIKKEVDVVIKDHGLGVGKTFWVLTVPAIWSDYSKDMMRTAAFKSGMIPAKQSSMLLLGIEPECAAVASNMWGAGVRFMVVDCGGGTIDITCHSIARTDPLELTEVTLPTGGPLGATQVDKEFLSFFASLIGSSNYENLEKKYPEEFLSFITKWEEVKVEFKIGKDGVASRLALTEMFSVLDLKYSDLEVMVNKWNESNQDKKAAMVKPPKVGLILSTELMTSFFNPVVDRIVDLILAQNVEDLELDYVVLVGGFSKSGLLKGRIEDVLQDKNLRIVASKDADMAIVKGAAMIGARMDNVVNTRKARCTFGVSMLAKYLDFNPQHSQHKDKIITIDDEEYLRVFHVHGQLGDDLEETGGGLHPYGPLTEMQSTASIQILVSNKKDVFLADEDGVKGLATTEVPFDLALPYDKRQLWVQFSFGGPEVTCHVFGPTIDEKLGTVALTFEHMVSTDLT